MPIIDGYDDMDFGGSFGFPEGEHTVTIASAKLTNGDRQAGGKWYALELGIEGAGNTANVKVYYPKDTAEWRSWTEGRRKLTGRQLERAGIHMSELENETARAALIGRTVTVKAEKNGDYMNYYFQQDTGSTDAATLPEPTQVFGGAPTPVAELDAAFQAVIV